MSYLKPNAYEYDIYLDNSLNVCLSWTTAKTTVRSHWQMGHLIIAHLDPKIKFTNKRPPQTTTATGWEHIVDLCNAHLVTHQNCKLNAEWLQFNLWFWGIGTN